MIRIGVLTPHSAKGPEEELPAMAPGLVEASVTRLRTVEHGDRGATKWQALRALSDPRLNEAAERFAAQSYDAIAYASTSYAYVAGHAAETAMVSRLSEKLGIPVAATCSSCVAAFRALDVARVALVHPPPFGHELNKLGAAYFQSQGVDVVSSMSADLPDDPRRIAPEAVCA
jgi:maleate isomerase